MLFCHPSSCNSTTNENLIFTFVVGANKTVYVHCNGGKGRSAVIVIAYLMKRYKLTREEAYRSLRAHRKIANLKSMFGLKPQWRVLGHFARKHTNTHQHTQQRSQSPVKP
jgi:protein-tyrosine phosphatase